MLDAIVAGAGPAGALTALLMARAGARVLIVDRSSFPRDKLCGDTLNPGAVALLGALGLGDGLAAAPRLNGMRLTGPGVSLQCRYPAGVSGLAIQRRTFDMWLLEAAIAAGAHFEPLTTVRRLIVDTHGHVRGVALKSVRGGEVRMPSLIVIGADGRRSAVARHANLSVPVRIRRWAFGAYATDVAGMTDLGEMHVRPGAYCGLAPLGNGVVNVCAVTTPRAGSRDPSEVLRQVIRSDAELSERLRDARFEPTRTLGPLAAGVRDVGVSGLLLVGDAAGFIDPMTGDGMHLALQGAELTAAEALLAIDRGTFANAVVRLAAARRRRFGAKLRFNRLMRRLVQVPALIGVAGASARIAPGLLRGAVAYAGDVR